MAKLVFVETELLGDDTRLDGTIVGMVDVGKDRSGEVGLFHRGCVRLVSAIPRSCYDH